MSVGRRLSSKVTGADRVTFEVLITKKELVNGLGISSSFINKLMAEESLPYFKLGRAVRFRISEVSLWLEHRRMA
jgi:excisionase family DNA binding protein